MFINSHSFKKPIGQGGHQNLNKKCTAVSKILFDLIVCTYFK